MMKRAPANLNKPGQTSGQNANEVLIPKKVIENAKNRNSPLPNLFSVTINENGEVVSPNILLDANEGISVIKSDDSAARYRIESGFFEKIALARANQMISRYEALAGSDHDLGQTKEFLQRQVKWIEEPPFLTPYSLLSYIGTEDWAVQSFGADYKTYIGETSVNHVAPGFLKLSANGDAQQLIGLSLDLTRQTFSPQISQILPILKRILFKALYPSGHYLFDIQTDNSANLKPETQKLLNEWFPGHAPGSLNPVIYQTLSIAEHLYENSPNWKNGFTWKANSKLDAKGRFEASGNNEGTLQYRPDAPDLLPTLLHELGHKAEYDLTVTDLVKLYRGLLARTANPDIRPIPGFAQYYSLSLYTPPDVPTSGTSQPLTRALYSGTVFKKPDSNKPENLITSFSTEFLSTSAERLVTGASFGAPPITQLEEANDFLQTDPMAVALFLKFANPTLYQAISKSFYEEMLKIRGNEDIGPAILDELLHVD